MTLMDELAEHAVDVRRVNLGPGDVLVFSVPANLNLEQFDRISKSIRAALPAWIHCLLIEGGMSIEGVVSAATAEQIMASHA